MTDHVGYEKKIRVPLSHLINLSFKSGIVPNALKRAKLTRIYKSGSESSIENYRPISILPAFSKVLEKDASNRIFSFLDKNNIILNPLQFAFRQYHSTSLAVISLVEKLIKAKEDKKCSIACFLDLSKAFDTVDHNILCTKLNHYGFRGVTNAWFQSYLSARCQCVQYGVTSAFNDITCSRSTRIDFRPHPFSIICKRCFVCLISPRR